ncbi:MAG: ABC transporter permease [Desulfobacteraceae bacterium]|nr:MAG: ABC transporter permease [Desulfobacteraceae bacterium]
MQGNRLKRILFDWHIYLVLVVFWIVSCFASPFFRTIDTFSTILLSAVPIALVGLGQTFVVLSCGFDLSVGAVASLATAIASVTMRWGIGPSIGLVILVSLLIGAMNGLGVSKLNIDSFIMTLGMMFFLTGVNFLIRPSPGGFIPGTFKRVVLYQVADFPVVPFLILLLAAIVGILVLQRRKFGREIYAVGGDPQSAKMSGVNVDRTRIKVFAVSALSAAMAGLFISARIGSGNAEAGAPYLFDSFTAVFMGGTLVTGGVGGYRGTIASALIIASIGQILQFLGITIWYHFIVKGLLLAGVAGTQLLIVTGRRT